MRTLTSYPTTIPASSAWSAANASGPYTDSTVPRCDRTRAACKSGPWPAHRRGCRGMSGTADWSTCSVPNTVYPAFFFLRSTSLASSEHCSSPSQPSQPNIPAITRRSHMLSSSPDVNFLLLSGGVSGSPSGHLVVPSGVLHHPPSFESSNNESSHRSRARPA